MLEPIYYCDVECGIHKQKKQMIIIERLSAIMAIYARIYVSLYMCALYNTAIYRIET